MKHVRLLSLVIAMMLCLFAVPAWAEETTVTVTTTIDAEELGLPSNDELFAYYVDQQLYGYEWATWGTAAGERLSAQQKLIYDALKKKIEDVAANGGSTHFVFEPSTIAGFDNTFTLTELGVSAFFEQVNGETHFTADTSAALENAIFGGVFDALVFDCPMDLYWFDKTNPAAMQQGYSASQSGDTLTITQLDITMQVASAYQGSSTTVVKPSNLDAVLANAKGVVEANKNKSSLEMLQAFKDYICDAVSYNEEAAADDYTGGYGDPWQLIYVFDGDTTTNVVCEGYSKAFQYLCDIAQTEYNALQDISVITVTGYMIGGTGEGPHMWNVVTMEDENNYIVDVTNSETGTVGQNGILFLGGTSNTTPRWTVTNSDGSSWGSIYVFKHGNGNTNNDYVQFNYDGTLPYSNDELALAPYSYTDAAYITAADGTITGYADAGDAFDAWGNGETLTLLEDYTTKDIITVSGAGKTLDLNGCTLKNSSSYGVIITNKTGLTIKNGNLKGYKGVSNQTGGTLVIADDVTFEGSYIVEYIAGSVTFEGENAADWKVFNGSGLTVTVDGNINLPSGYSLLDGSGNPLTEMKMNTAGTIKAYTHTHSYSWVTTDPTEHWQKCACGEVDESTCAAHDYEYTISTDKQTHTAKCTGCAKTITNAAHTFTADNNYTCICGAVKLFSVSITTPNGGTVTASASSAAAGTTITLTVTPNAGYLLSALTVTDAQNQPVTVTNNTFIMPAADVTVTATFAACTHSNVTATDNEDGTHKVVCGACGTTTAASVDHTFTAANSYKCTCGAEAVATTKVGANGTVTYHTNLQNALDVAKTTSETVTVTLLRNVTLPDEKTLLCYGKTTLDMQGYSITLNVNVYGLQLNGTSFTVVNAGTTGTIQNTSSATVAVVSGTFAMTGGQVGSIESYSNTTVTLENVTLLGHISTRGQTILTDVTMSDQCIVWSGSLTVKSGTLTDCIVYNGGNISLDGDFCSTNEGQEGIKVTSSNGWPSEGTFTLPDGYAFHDSAAANANVVVPVVGQAGTYYIKAHTHKYTVFTPDDTTDTITASCACGKAEVKTATLGNEENVVTYNGQPRDISSSCNFTDEIATLTITYNTADGGKPVNAGIYTATMTVGNASGEASVSANFTIKPKTLTIFSATIADVVYNEGGNYTLTVTGVSFNNLEFGEMLALGTDYTATAVLNGTPSAAGTTADATVTVTLRNGNYTLGENNTFSAKVNVVAHQHDWSYTAAGATITAQCGAAGCPDSEQTVTIVAPTNQTYDGQEKAATLDGSIDGVALPEIIYNGTDRTNVTGTACVASITLGEGDAAATAQVEFTIAAKDINGATIGAVADQAYTGSALEPALTITVGANELALDTDYTVAYANNVNVGTANFTITGQGNYTGTASGTFSVVPASIADAAVTAAEQVYTGEEIKPDVSVVLNGKTLALTTDYTVAYANNVNAGTATITVTGKGNYTGTATGSFTITQSGTALTATTYLGDTATTVFTYGDTITVTGSAAVAQTFALRPQEKQVGLYYGNVELATAEATSGTFTLTYNTTDKKLVPSDGKLTLTVEYGGSDNLKEKSATVEITLKAKEITIDDAIATDRVYDGTNVVVVDSIFMSGVINGDSVTLLRELETTGTISAADVGQYDSVVLEKMELTGDDAKYYTLTWPEDNVVKLYKAVSITPKAVTATVELSQTSYVYDGNAKEPTVTVKDGDTVIPAGEYTVSYANNTEAGTATVTITDKNGGNYTVSGSATFTINQSGTELNAEADKASCIYGETITVTGEVQVTGAAPVMPMSLDEPATQQVALFQGETQLTDPVDVTDGAYELFYTTTKPLSIGANTLTVKFVGDTNMADTFANVTITLTQRQVTPSISGTVTKAYDGTTAVPEGLSIELGGVLTGDNVTATATYAYADANVGTGKTISATGITLGSAGDEAYYVLSATTTTADVGTITQAIITSVTAPQNATLDAYCTTADQAAAKLPNAVAAKAGEADVTLPITWSCENYNSAPKATNPFTWTVTNDNNNYTFAADVPQAGTIIVTNVDAIPVTLTGTGKSITYDGSAYDVSAMFDIGENAGAATYAIAAGGTGAGTLDGSKLTITEAGTFSIRLTTAANGEYAAAEATATLTVAKGEPAVIVPAGLTATYGDTLAAVTLPDGWSWKDDTASVGDAGEQTHKATYTPADTKLWNTKEADVTITVAQAKVVLEGVAKTYLGETEATEFTYGETITVKVAPAVPAVMALDAEYAEPKARQMALFYNGTQISDPADAVEGVYTMTYATTDKVLPAGDTAFTAEFVGDANVSNGTAKLSVTIKAATLTLNNVVLKDRAYQPGNIEVEVVSADVTGKVLEDDQVYVNTAAMRCYISNAQAGTYFSVILPATVGLNGSAAEYYTVAGGNAFTATVKITKAEPVGKPETEQPYTPGITLGDVKLPEDAFDVPGTLDWVLPDGTPVAPGEEYDWVFTPDDTANYEPITGTTVIFPEQTKPPVEPDPVILPIVIEPAQAQVVTVTEGETAAMTIVAANADTYQWYINRNDGLGWRAITGANAPAYTTSVTTLMNDGYLYLCQVSNEDGTVSSPVFTLEVLPAVEIPDTGDHTPTLLWAALLLVSAAGILTMAKAKRRFS